MEEKSEFAYAAALKILGKDEERKNYCYETRGAFTIYVIDYFEPMLEELRASGKLKKGK